MEEENLREKMLQSILEVKNAFNEAENTAELLSCVKNLMPLPDTDYKIVNVKGTTTKFKASVKCSLKNADNLNKFISNYNLENNETLKVSKTRIVTDHTSPYQMIKYFRCHHNTRYEPTMNTKEILRDKPQKRFKNTNCQFSLIMRLCKTDEECGSLLDIEWNHNHPTNSLHALSFKEIPTAVIDTIKDMFSTGLLPGAAHKEFMRELRSQCKDDMEYHLKLADRSKVPRRCDFNDIYAAFNKNLYGTESLKSMFCKIKERISALNEKDNDYTIVLQEFDEEINQPFILTIITPLMKRIHKWIPQAKDLAFLDSSSNMEEFNLRVFLMVTHSVCGALPLGIIITSDETTETLVDALSQFKSALPDDAFFGSSSKGPRVFMTDNCLELRNAICQTWPDATPVLCIFHLLQQIWRWLHDRNHGIVIEDRPHILLGFKRVLYAECEEDFQAEYQSLLEDEIASKYPNFIKYISDVCNDCESWALCYRQDLPLRGNNTNNYCESQFLVIKDDVLNRQKEVNVVGLIDKLTKELDDHYQNKLLSVASGKFDGIYSKRFAGFSKKKEESLGFHKPSSEAQELALQDLVSLGENTYQMKSFSKEGTTYLVDMTLGVCECKRGTNGDVCKHQFVLWANKVAQGTNFLPVFSAEQRMNLAKVAIGNTMPLGYYEGIHDRVITMPENSGVKEDCGGYQVDDSSGVAPRPMQRRNQPQELITKADCQKAIAEAMGSIEAKIDESNQNLMRGILKFAERVKSMPVSKLTSCFHTFGAAGVVHSRVTATSIVKRAKRGKIHVQPEAVKRRKVESGSRTTQKKGQLVKHNPFKRKAGKQKRCHQFAENVRRNEPVSKKAGRTMSTKTRCYES